MRIIFSSNCEGRVRARTRRALAALAGASVFFAALAASPGCRPAGDPVRETLDKLARAASHRDAGGVVDLLSPDFRAADGTRLADADATIRRYFAAYESLRVDFQDVAIERSEGAALVRFRADMTGKPSKIGGGVLEGLIPSNSSWQFELRLVPVGGKWKIAWASWSEAR